MRDPAHIRRRAGLTTRDRLRILSALRGSALFSQVSAHLFHDLLDHVGVHTLAAGEALEETEPHFVLVLDGRVSIYEMRDGARSLAHVLNGPALYGEAQVVRGAPVTHTLVARTEALVAHIPASAVHGLPADLRNEIERISHELEGREHRCLRAAAPQAPRYVYVSSDPRYPIDVVAGLTRCLARSIGSNFGETAIAVRKRPEGGYVDGAGQVLDALPDAGAAYVLVALGPERRPHAVPESESQPGLHVVLTPPGTSIPTGEGLDREQVLETVVLDPGASRRTGDDNLTLVTYEDRRCRTCRLELSGRALSDMARVGAAATPGPEVQALVGAHAASLARWARFVTRRAVAFAFGGGGAWGYFHVALLNRVLDRGVPVDMVSGTSFGALVAVYFAALGRPGLDLLVKRGKSFEFTQTLSMISTHPLELQIARDLDQADLSRLPIVANPFTTNLTRVNGEAAVAGPAALGARASSSAPGVFGPTVLAKSGVFVDGVVAGNVPSAILIAQGADMLVSSNVIPRPPPKKVPPFALARWLSQVSPLDRVYEAYLSALFFLYAQGADHPGLGCVSVQGNDAIESLSKPMLPSDFGRARALVEHATEHPSVVAAADRIAEEWGRRRRPRA